MHSGTGEGMHADGEYVVWQSVEELARIQIEYLKVWRMLKAGGNTGQRQGRKRRQNRCFPLCGRWRRKLWKKISCVSGEGLAFAEASFDLSEFATVRLSGCKFKNCSFYRTSLVKVLIENCSFAGCRFEAVTGRMCLLKRANLPGAILTKLFSKIRCFGGVCCNMPI